MLDRSDEDLIEASGDAGEEAQLLLWDPLPDPGGPFPHPPAGTYWQRRIAAQPPGPLVFGRPER